MSTFNTNKNAFLSSVQLLKNDFHAYASLGVAKSSRNEKQQKRSLINNITNAIENIDTADFGIRVILLKTKE
ncbi:hypothetical protein [Aestuariivirga sp.]|jgi:hypothetical protein|uniref:hypothetical protein n=1 Tax=Aestuariivirga sp. TaxID=2650926 RepID=UPI003784DF49